MFKILNFIKSIIGKLFVIDWRVRREFDDEVRFLLEVVKTVEFDNGLTLRNGEPLSCDIILKSEFGRFGEGKKERKTERQIQRE